MYRYDTCSIEDGCDCWGRIEYKSVYRIFHNDKQIFTTSDNPNKLVNYLNEIETEEDGVSVDKDELLRALKYDRDQYEKGRQDMQDFVEQKCRELGIDYTLIFTCCTV